MIVDNRLPVTDCNFSPIDGVESGRKDQAQSKRTSWYCRPQLCICFWSAICAATIVGAVVALAHLPLYRQKEGLITHQQDSAPFLLMYGVNLTNATNLMVANKLALVNKLMTRFNLPGITVVTTQFSSPTSFNSLRQQFPQYNITQCQAGLDSTDSILFILLIVEYSSECNTISCRQAFVEDARQRIMQLNTTTGLSLTLNDGRIFDGDMRLCSVIPMESNLPIGGLSSTTGATTTTTVCVRGTCVNVGNLGVVLTWSRTGDADLVLTTPNNKSIYWRNRGASTGTDQGYLDRDDRSGTGPENIYWSTNRTRPPNGTYHVCVQPYEFTSIPSEANPLYTTITVRWSSNITVTFTKINKERYSSHNECFPNSNGCLGSFRYP